MQSVGCGLYMSYRPTLTSIQTAGKLLRSVFEPTPLQFSKELSIKYGARIYLKREDLTPVRSYKIRGSFVKMHSLVTDLGAESVVTCSAGNHAQGVAFGCDWFKIRGDIFMPKITTAQKIRRVKQLGGDSVRIFLEGDTFDECSQYAHHHASETTAPFLHPFDDEKVIEGQGTVAKEILEQSKGRVDVVLLPVGGGGLAAGVSSYFRICSPFTRIIGTGPHGAPAMYRSLEAGSIVTLDTIQTFVDGASVKRVGSRNFPIISENIAKMLQIDEGQVCTKILEMYNDFGLILEPAGVLSLCGLDVLSTEEVKGKTIVVVLSGGNSDVFRMPEIFHRSLAYEGRKHFFRIQFRQTSGALKEFVQTVLGPTDDIIYFRYTKRINRETGPVILGIETENKEDRFRILEAMHKHSIVYETLHADTDLDIF